MPSSERVRDDDDGIAYADADGHDYILSPTKGGKWRVYEDGTSYSSTSGQLMAKGPVLRDVDGSMLTFRSQADAQAWIDDGCKISLD